MSTVSTMFAVLVAGLSGASGAAQNACTFNAGSWRSEPYEYEYKCPCYWNNAVTCTCQGTGYSYVKSFTCTSGRNNGKRFFCSRQNNDGGLFQKSWFSYSCASGTIRYPRSSYRSFGRKNDSYSTVQKQIVQYYCGCTPN